MAVCRLAIMSFRDNTDYGGYSKHDLLDCIEFARWQLELGRDNFSHDTDVLCRPFIKWAKHKLNVKG